MARSIALETPYPLLSLARLWVTARRRHAHRPRLQKGKSQQRVIGRTLHECVVRRYVEQFCRLLVASDVCDLVVDGDNQRAGSKGLFGDGADSDRHLVGSVTCRDDAEVWRYLRVDSPQPFVIGHVSKDRRSD